MFDAGSIRVDAVEVGFECKVRYICKLGEEDVDSQSGPDHRTLSNYRGV